MRSLKTCGFQYIGGVPSSPVALGISLVHVWHVLGDQVLGLVSAQPYQPLKDPKNQTTMIGFVCLFNVFWVIFCPFPWSCDLCGILSHATTSLNICPFQGCQGFDPKQFPQRFALQRRGVVVSQHVFTQMKVDDPKPFGAVTWQQAEPTKRAHEMDATAILGNSVPKGSN